MDKLIVAALILVSTSVSAELRVNKTFAKCVFNVHWEGSADVRCDRLFVTEEQIQELSIKSIKSIKLARREGEV